MGYGYAIGCGLISFVFIYFLLSKISAAYLPLWINGSSLWGLVNVLFALFCGAMIFKIVPKR